MRVLPYSRIVSRAMRDSEFRDALQRDVKAALAAEFGIEVPKDVEVTVLADTLEVVHAVLPAEPGLHGEERGVVKEMLQRFRADDKFRKAALTDLKAVIEREHDVRLPERPKVKAVLETREHRYIHLPHPATASITSLPEAEAAYGGGNGGGYSDNYAGTYETGGVCTCLTRYDLSSSLPTCCDGPPQTETPEGGGGGGDRVG